MCEEQEAFDEVFERMVLVDETLDAVIVNLLALGVRVEPWQRLIVSRWLDMFSIDTPISLDKRLAMLRGWLAESCRAR